MQFTITGRHIEISDAMRDYSQGKAGKLTRYYDRITTADLICEQEANQYRVEMVIRADHKHTFVAHVEASDFYEAMDLLVDKMGRQLSDHKSKVRNRKHSKTGPRPPEAV